MATIGTFTKTDTGFTGSVKTLIFKPQIAARFLLNRAAARTLIAQATVAGLADHDPPALKRGVGQRVIFADAMRTGQLVGELDPESLAAREVAALAAEIEELAP